jgi:hypothetical protein
VPDNLSSNFGCECEHSELISNIMIVLDSDHITNTHGAKDYLLSTSQGRMQKHPKNQMPPAGFHVDEHFD